MNIFRRTHLPLNPVSGSFPVSGGVTEHDLNDRAMHTGVLAEEYVAFALDGHNHDGIGSASVDHAHLLNGGSTSHSQIDAHINKRIAVPQTELSSAPVNAAVYRIMDTTPAFVGRAGATANSVMALLGEDVVVGASGNPVTIVNITSDLAGTVSVVGAGYVAQPYVHFSEPIPNIPIRIRYGIEMTLDTLPESVLINEPLWVGETDQNVRALVAEIKGGAFDRVVDASQNLQGLDARILTLNNDLAGISNDVADVTNSVNNMTGSVQDLDNDIQGLDGRVGVLEGIVAAGASKQFGIAPEFANMVFDNDGLAASNGTWVSRFESLPNMFHTALQWSTNLSTEQHYRVKVAVKLPNDFGAWDSACPIKIWRKSAGLLDNVALHVTMHDIANAATNIDYMDISNSTTNAWEQFEVAPVSSGNFVANGWFVLTLEAMANGIGNTISIGRIDFNYVTA